MRRSFGLLKILLCVGLSCMCLFLAVGYAALSGTLSITGTASYEPGTIYITSVELTGYSNTTGQTPQVTKFGYLSFVHNDYSMPRNASVTISATVKNNSGITQIFDIVLPKDERDYDISVSPAQGTKVEHGKTQTFTITITNNSRTTISFNQIINTLQFQLDEDNLTAEAAKGIAERFAQILNETGGSITVDSTTYQPAEIMPEIRENMNSASSGGYISNVVGAEEQDQKLLNAVFGEDAMLVVGNQEFLVKIMMKEQEITSDGHGKELTLYVTADPLTEGGTWNFIWGEMRNVPVYTIVFGQVDTGEYDDQGNKIYEWEQLGDMLAGTAPVCNYSGTNLYGGTGSFQTDYWRSSNDEMLSDAYKSANP